MKKLTILLTMLMATSAFAKEIFFECEMENLGDNPPPKTIDGKPWLFEYSIDTNAKTGTFTENRTAWIEHLEGAGMATIKKVKTEMSSSTLFLSYCSVNDGCREYAVYHINRETLELTRGPQEHRGNCKIIEKDNKF